MQPRQQELTPVDKFVSDNLTHKPTVANSVFNNLAMGAATSAYAIKSFNDEYNKSPEGREAASIFESIRRGNENPEVGWSQWGANQVANMVGQGLSPLTWAFGEIGGLVMKPVTAGLGMIAPKAIQALARKPITELLGERVGKYIPEAIGTAEEKQTLSLALFGKKVAQGFGIGAGAMLPQATIDNFNAETGKHDILGMAESMGAGGVFGMAISTIPFAWGILKANINRARGKPSNFPLPPDDATKAFNDGLIDKDTYELWKEADQYVSTPEGRADLKMRMITGKRDFKADTTKYVSSQGHPVDHASDTAQFEILNQEQITNLQSATADQLVSHNIPPEHKDALTNFTVQAGLDEMRNKPGLLDGVRGYVEYASKNLLNKEVILQNADKLVDEHFTLNTFYHGSDLEHEISYDISKANEDLEFGQGFWITSSKDLAERYKKTKLEEIKIPGHEKIYDVDNGTDAEINARYEDISKAYKQVHEKLKLNKGRPKKYKIKNVSEQDMKPIEDAREKFRNALKKKGYKGVKRKAKYTLGHFEKEEIMLFEKPKLNQEINFPFSQSSIYKIIKERGSENKLPLAIPEEVTERLKQEERISKLERKNQQLFEKYEQTGNENFTKQMQENNNKIEEINKNLKHLKSPQEELHSIKEDLLPGNKLRKDHSNRESYHRLQDLADVWHPAKTLLDRIKLEDELNAQEAYRDLAQQMLNIADSNVGQLADSSKVEGYMQARIAQRIDEPKPNEKLIEESKNQKVASDSENVIAESDRQIENTDHESTKHEYEKAKDKFNEFKKSEVIFRDFINCVLGSKK